MAKQIFPTGYTEEELEYTRVYLERFYSCQDAAPEELAKLRELIMLKREEFREKWNKEHPTDKFM